MAGPEQSDVQRALNSLGASMLPYRSFAEIRDQLGGLTGAVDANAATAAAFPLLAAALPGVVVPDASENRTPVPPEPAPIIQPLAEANCGWPWPPRPGLATAAAPHAEEPRFLSAPAPGPKPTAAPPRTATSSLADVFRFLRGKPGGTPGRSGFLSDS